MSRVVHVFQQHWRLVFLTVALIVVAWLAYAWWTILLPFALGLILAYLLEPVISWIERKLPRFLKWHQAGRIIAIIFVALLILAVLGSFGYVVIGAIVDAVAALVEAAPQFIQDLIDTIQDWIGRLPEGLREPLEDFAGGATETVIDAIQGAVANVFSFVADSINLILGFAALPLVLYYLLKDSDKLSRGFYAAFPEWLRGYVRDIVRIIERVLGRYIRAELLMGFFVGLTAFLGLYFLGIPYAPALAALYGVGELIPVLGPWLTGAVAVLVTLAVAPEQIVWVLILYFGIQIFEGNVLAPKIQGEYMRIHPVFVLFLLVLGAYLAGFIGLILIVPLTATIVDIIKYLNAVARAEDEAGTGEPAAP
ncbi:MAG: AI-2E family transporter [Dehalococcoidia bacterium]|nr:AI-2E family transporter [Dehalococcoidia bacterium]